MEQGTNLTISWLVLSLAGGGCLRLEVAAQLSAESLTSLASASES